MDPNALTYIPLKDFAESKMYASTAGGYTRKQKLLSLLAVKRAEKPVCNVS